MAGAALRLHGNALTLHYDCTESHYACTTNTLRLHGFARFYFYRGTPEDPGVPRITSEYFGVTDYLGVHRITPEYMDYSGERRRTSLEYRAV